MEYMEIMGQKVRVSVDDIHALRVAARALQVAEEELDLVLTKVQLQQSINAEKDRHIDDLEKEIVFLREVALSRGKQT